MKKQPISLFKTITLFFWFETLSINCEMKKLLLPSIFSILTLTSFSQFSILGEQKISDLQGNFLATLDNGDIIGVDIEGIGDLDLDGIPDVAISTTRDDDGGSDWGAVYIVFLYANGTVKDYQKISSTEGGFGAALENEDHFGGSLALIGDLNDDGVQDIAVGAYDDDDGGTDRGAVYVLLQRNTLSVSEIEKTNTIAIQPNPVSNSFVILNDKEDKQM